ncbi:hypothetical protein P691DRAFT_803053 [Macrolepiota fuliginosa MF-IS2]|uniref:Uncharacterized protein n=1 Tax=Macrolepiota fuliginosa MF-IS2 TaxID=1400762 RepID=A0A9P6C313_9AGAR|nr:hypothetical protein P691DRAFT_803053 [Macrolepiota fuliginosa MF-IS2]
MALQIGIPLQSCSSVLVILQVARGRAIGSETNTGSKESESHRLDTVVLTHTSFHDD